MQSKRYTEREWLQDKYGVELWFQFPDEEKFLFNKDLSFNDTEKWLNENMLDVIALGFKPKKTIAVKDVVKIVSDFYNIKEESIYEKTRHKEVIRPRQIIMYLLREDFNISYPSIGQKLGGRDHTTVIHSCEKVKTEIKEDQTLIEEIDPP